LGGPKHPFSWSATTATTATKANNLNGGSVGSIPYQSLANTTALLAPGAAGTFLQSNGPNAPIWASIPITYPTATEASISIFAPTQNIFLVYNASFTAQAYAGAKIRQDPSTYTNISNYPTGCNVSYNTGPGLAWIASSDGYYKIDFSFSASTNGSIKPLSVSLVSSTTAYYENWFFVNLTKTTGVFTFTRFFSANQLFDILIKDASGTIDYVYYLYYPVTINITKLS
jgi:hypothetical protein